MSSSLIVHPSDPTAHKIGGIESFIRGYLTFAPPSLEIRYVGVTTEGMKRPVGAWSTILVGSRRIKFFPVMEVADLQRRSRVPMALRFTWSLVRHRRSFAMSSAIVQFHRPGPALAFLLGGSRMIQIIHLTPETEFAASSSESRWRRVPWLFRLLESITLPRMSRIFIVNALALPSYRRRFRRIKERFEHLPNWADGTIFFPNTSEARLATRRTLHDEFNLPLDAPVVLFVGRLEGIKDPDLMLRTFAEFVAEVPSARLVVVGEGSMREDLAHRVEELPLAGRVALMGGLAPGQVAELMNASDALLVTSASEGMPVTVLEALACGLPVVSTDVGAVASVVQHRRAGWISEARTPGALVIGLKWVLSTPRGELRDATLAASKPYGHEHSLQRLYRLHEDHPFEASRRSRRVQPGI